MKLPKEQIDRLREKLRTSFSCRGVPGLNKLVVDPKDLDDLILYAELAEAKLVDLENRLETALEMVCV